MVSNNTKIQQYDESYEPSCRNMVAFKSSSGGIGGGFGMGTYCYDDSLVPDRRKNPSPSPSSSAACQPVSTIPPAGLTEAKLKHALNKLVADVGLKNPQQNILLYNVEIFCIHYVDANIHISPTVQARMAFVFQNYKVLWEHRDRFVKKILGELTEFALSLITIQGFQVSPVSSPASPSHAPPAATLVASAVPVATARPEGLNVNGLIRAIDYVESKISRTIRGARGRTDESDVSEWAIMSLVTFKKVLERQLPQNHKQTIEEKLDIVVKRFNHFITLDNQFTAYDNKSFSVAYMSYLAVYVV